jgi:hypothetical protein
MVHDIGKWQIKQNRGRARDLLGRQIIESPARTRARHERFLALLKSRYGYTNEKAVDELARLLKQFDDTNRSLGTPNSKHPPAESHDQDVPKF